MSSKDADPDDIDDDDVEQLQFKVILLGDGAVGKTSIATRFCHDSFASNYKQTIGLDFFIHRMQMGTKSVALQIWDIGGQTIGSKMIHNYIYGANAVLLTYDITNYESFQNLEDWYRLVRKTFEKETMPYCALLANKCDLSHIRAVRNDAHNRFADENELFGYMMSAKSGDQVASAFRRIAASLAGVVLSKPELESQNRVVSAQIVNHARHDPEVEGGAVPTYSGSKSNCCIS